MNYIMDDNYEIQPVTYGKMNKEKEEFSRQSTKMSGDKLKAYYLHALIGAVNRGADLIVAAINAQSVNQGKWLGAIATAISLQVPADDPRLVELTAQIKAEADAFEAVADQAKQPPE